MRAGLTVVGVDHHEVDDDPLPEHAQAVPRVVVAGHPLEEVLAPVDGLDEHRGDEADHDAERDEHEHRQHVLHRLLRLREIRDVERRVQAQDLWRADTGSATILAGQGRVACAHGTADVSGDDGGDAEGHDGA